MDERVVTYLVRFLRGKELLDVEIHRTMDEAAASGMNYLAVFGQNLACSQLEQLLISWDPEEDGALVWGDDEYELRIEPYLAQHSPREDNDCRVIPLQRRMA